MNQLISITFVTYLINVVSKNHFSLLKNEHTFDLMSEYDIIIV